jgi:hypothetical protein
VSLSLSLSLAFSLSLSLFLSLPLQSEEVLNAWLAQLRIAMQVARLVGKPEVPQELKQGLLQKQGMKTPID